jgi:cold shock CspA family protein
VQTLEVGTVKWFGGYNRKLEKDNNFGFIERGLPREDLYVHASGLACHLGELEEGTVVVFQVGEGKKKGQMQAFEVRRPDFSNPEERLLCAESDLADAAYKGLFTMLEYDGDFVSKNVKFWEERLRFLKANDKGHLSTVLAEKMPDTIFHTNPYLRSYLGNDRKIRLLSQWYQMTEDEALQLEYLNELQKAAATKRSFENTYWIRTCEWDGLPIDSNRIEWFSGDYKQDEWDVIPFELVTKEMIWKEVPEHKKIGILLHEWNKGGDTDPLLQKFREMAKDRETRKRLPEQVKGYKAVYELLEQVEQVQIAWPYISPYWDHMKRDAKILSVFRASKEDINLELAERMPSETDLLVKMVLMLLGKKAKYPLTEAHQMLEQYVQEEAWKSTEPLDFGPLFAKCIILPNVGCCEARRWPVKEGGWLYEDGLEQAFCPRSQTPCTINTSPHSNLAHVHPVMGRSWENWTLTEFFAKLGVPLRSASQNKNDTYLLKMAGWINRLNEIRKRMTCHTCGKMLVPDQRYAFYPARYNSTVAHCPDGHGDGVYFNHCWNCIHIIDSRESSVKMHKYYLCIRCGAGPKPVNPYHTYYPGVPAAHQPPAYKQGDKCPKCGTLNMKDVPNMEDVKECQNPRCKHQIHLKGREIKSRYGHYRRY